MHVASANCGLDAELGVEAALGVELLHAATATAQLTATSAIRTRRRERVLVRASGITWDSFDLRAARVLRDRG
jgi:hypothetical protein